jgi:hypothetical protein
MNPAVQARLRYRKANQFFMDAVYPQRREEAPITDISLDSEQIPVLDGSPTSLGHQRLP